MSETRDAEPTEIGGSEQRVLLLVSGERDRELLADRLGDRYHVAAAAADAEWGDFDLCVVDAGTYRTVAEDLAARKADTDVFLPVLLLVQDRGDTREAEWLSEELGGTVDDVIVVPSPKQELDARVDSLLRTRRQSRQLALYRRAMDEATLGIIITDSERPDNPIVYANDWFCKMTGYDEETLLGRNCRILQGPETDDETVAEIREAIDAEEPVTVELRNYRADGTPFWNLLTITPVRDAAGEVTHFLGFQRDVTDRVEARESFQQEREIIEKVFDTSPVGIAVIDTDGNFVRANATVEEELGLARSEITARAVDAPDWDIVDVDGEPIPSEDVPAARTLATGEPVEDYRMGITVDGERLWLSVDCAPLLDQDGIVEGAVASIQDVTDRVERKRELEQYETVVQTIPDAAWVFDEDERLTVANERFMELFPVPREDVMGYRVTDFEPMFADPETFEAYHGLIQDLLAGRREEGKRDVTVELPEGRIITNLNLAAIPGEDGPSGVAVISRDITDRVERERELERASLVLETMEDGVWTIDRDRRLSFVNDSVVERLPLDAEDIVGTPIEQFRHLFGDEAAFDRYDDAIEDLLAGRIDEATIDVTLSLPGETMVANLGLAAIQGEDGPTGVVVVSSDITDRFERERELERYEAIVQTTSDLIYVLDPDGHFIRVNDAMVETSGYDREELLGSHASLVGDDEIVEHTEAQIRSLLTGESDQTTFDATMTFKDGVQREFVASLAILRDDDGEFQGTVVSAHDITELRENQRRLSVLDRVLRHNLRNRMNVVLGYSQELGDHSDPEVSDLGQAIEESARELLQLSESAREFESVVSGAAQETTTLDATDLVAAAVDDARDEHPAAEVSTDLPEAAPVRAHETFELALDELLENAIVHNDAETPAVDVSVAADDRVEIRIADDGPGLNDIDRRALDTGTESPLEHTQGLGLWLVRWAVSSVGGELDIADNDPRGTVLTLTLPRASD